MNRHLVLTLSFFFLARILSEASVPAPLTHDAAECGSQLSCGGCISRHPSCAWCADKTLPEGLTQRCGKAERINSTCRQVEFPVNRVRILRDVPLSGIVNPGEEDLAIQLRPQEVRLRLRPNVPSSFRVQFQQAQDYPVDLYYLMDLSYTMRDDKANLEHLGAKLAKEMKRITRNFRLGFGSFVDKKLLPFHQTHPEIMDRPCSGCPAPYGFHNNMPLSTETNRFEEEVRRARISGNLDTPEGGLDALMQVVVCKKEIGWRNTSRKIVVLSTDDDYHIAGDGKIVGIIEPNDGLCHLVDGWYVASTERDYPSMAQLKTVLDAESINVIYAVTRSQVEKYQQLRDRLGSGFVGVLTSDSSNIEGLVRKEYEKITSLVELDHNAPSFLRVNFYSTCKSGPRRKTSRCSGLKVDTKITFDVEVELVTCPPKSGRTGQQAPLTFQISPPGLKDAVTVRVDPLCSCECEHPSQQEPHSAACSGGKGALQCGVCQCYEGWKGTVCQCNASSFDPTLNTAACLRHPEDKKVCSGRGICQCGRCICHQNPPQEISGDYCEYDNFSCDKASNGKVCGGPDHGRCGKDGKCECLGEYEGPQCMCSVRKDRCLNEDGVVCSGKGECLCNQCHCTTPGYSGPTCRDCFGCEGQCEILRDCVHCEIFQELGAGSEHLSCRDVNCTFDIQGVDKLEDHLNDGDLKLCNYLDSKGCKYIFAYRVVPTGRHLVLAEKTKVCPKSQLLVYVGGVIGGTVLLGLLVLLLFKLVTTVQDQMEWAKFKKEQELRKWSNSENPLYKTAVSTFENPTFRRHRVSKLQQ